MPKMKLPRWGVIDTRQNRIAIVSYNREWADECATHSPDYRVVYLDGEFTYRILKR